MDIRYDQIDKARARGADLDLEGLVARTREMTPRQMTTPKELADRKNFLRESLGSEAPGVLERIIDGNEIQDVNYLARGARAAKAVARISVQAPSGQRLAWGTGFVIAKNVLLTNNHVLPDPGTAARSEAHFQFEIGLDLEPLEYVSYALDPKRLFFTAPALDFTVVAVNPKPINGDDDLGVYGCIPLVATLGKVTDGEYLTIVQHPKGGRKQICVRENKLLKRDKDVLWYSTDTQGGSSGSPVFNNDWYVVALHHSGVPEERSGKFQTIDGRDFDPARDQEDDIKWVANEGIRVSRIVETLRHERPNEPLLTPMYASTPESARIAAPSIPLPLAAAARRSSEIVAPSSKLKDLTMSDSAAGRRTVTVTLGIEPDGTVSVMSSGATAAESALVLEAAKKKAKKPPAIDVPFDSDYSTRGGYNPDFLAKSMRVDLPALGDSLEEAAAQLLKPRAKNKYVLDYHNYSLVMHHKRRLAIYTAANVDFAGRYDLPRPSDVWREDPRIPAEAQLTNFYYAGNKFDRGHLTRREDLEYGKTYQEALASAADTCHWTNCTPQHERFNQNKELWQGIERHVYENAIRASSFKAQVLTGPILEEDDPVWDRFPKIMYPVRFWKVVAAVNASGKLFATAFILDQSETIGRFGIEAAVEVPFAPYKTFQVPIAEVERLTTLTFRSGPKSLSEFDPRKNTGALRRAGRLRPQESAAAAALPAGYVELESLDSIQLDE